MENSLKCFDREQNSQTNGNLWITTKFGEMLQPKNVHQLLRNQNSGVPCGTFSSTTTMTTKINSKWGPKRKIY